MRTDTGRMPLPATIGNLDDFSAVSHSLTNISAPFAVLMDLRNTGTVVTWELMQEGLPRMEVKR